ncbi:hypothetical protein TREES_T100009658 [Tupaia chinensis]|uniref:Uncharacterized protein n=1 Tax=Tupaia chinensis TaxID=246437 RepID=L9LBM1_TUPCH|nr:hypothetical protein TREES_T100009658 [Tupaia chinensis]
MPRLLCCHGAVEQDVENQEGVEGPFARVCGPGPAVRQTQCRRGGHGGWRFGCLSPGVGPNTENTEVTRSMCVTEEDRELVKTEHRAVLTGQQGSSQSDQLESDLIEAFAVVLKRQALCIRTAI